MKLFERFRRVGKCVGIAGRMDGEGKWEVGRGMGRRSGIGIRK
jgi:hypothetical protein